MDDAAKAEILTPEERRDRELENDSWILHKAGIIEIAVRNPNVMSHMKEWEARALKAEAQLSAKEEECRDAWGARAAWQQSFEDERKIRLQSEAREVVLREALEKIERWFGEFPETGEVWQDGSPMSYAARCPDILFTCKARTQNTGANDPQDCNWPVCGCDHYANRVIAALEDGAHKGCCVCGQPIEWDGDSAAHMKCVMPDGADR